MISVRNLTIGSAIMNIRRLPGFMYHYKLATVLLMSSLFLVVYLLLHWGIMCTNLEAWRHVSTVVSFTACYSDRNDAISHLRTRCRLCEERVGTG